MSSHFIMWVYNKKTIKNHYTMPQSIIIIAAIMTISSIKPFLLFFLFCLEKKYEEKYSMSLLVEINSIKSDPSDISMMDIIHAILKYRKALGEKKWN